MRFLICDGGHNSQLFSSSDREDNNPRSIGQLAHAQGQAGAGLSRPAPAIGIPSSASSPLVDEPSGAVARHPATQAPGHRRLLADKAGLSEDLQSYVTHWNEHAHRFNWSTKSAAGVMAKCQLAMAA